MMISKVGLLFTILYKWVSEMGKANNKGFFLVSKVITNRYRHPITVVSGEFENINKSTIPPQSHVEFTLPIPVGFRPYSNRFTGYNKEPHIYIGYVDESF